MKYYHTLKSTKQYLYDRSARLEKQLAEKEKLIIELKKRNDELNTEYLHRKRIASQTDNRQQMSIVKDDQ